MKKRNISIATFLRLQKFNDVRKLQADVFALAHRSILALLIESRRNDDQIATEMNKLGLRTATGLRWTTKSLRQLRNRLDALIRNADAQRPGVSVENGGIDIERMDKMYLDRLDALYYDNNHAFMPGLNVINSQFYD